MVMKNPKNNRSNEITQKFIQILELHLEDIVAGRADEYLEIKDLAEKLFIHPIHLSNTIKETTGKSPCEICHDKTIAKAKELLSDPTLSISIVAKKLTYDPSNFTKYFKNRTGIIPSEFKKIVFRENSETITIE
jgi:AraC family transcriptional regulator of adaptative response / methylphosphotriester-DNA alkyltransferase methyltransferase